MQKLILPVRIGLGMTDCKALTRSAIKPLNETAIIIDNCVGTSRTSSTVFQLASSTKMHTINRNM